MALDLTARQTEILDLMCQGYVNKEIAIKLKSTPAAIIRQIQRARQKNYCQTTAQLVAEWVKELLT